MERTLVKVHGSWKVRYTETYPSPLRGSKSIELPIYPFMDDDMVKELADNIIQFEIIELEVEGIPYEFAQVVKA